jgi:lipopolysaccharide biosynthesis glycosyltransferase
MVIAICFDKNYQKWATVCLYSIIKHYNNPTKIRLVILSDINYNQCIWQLKRVLKNFDFTFDNPGNDFDSMPTGYHFNVTTYWRLALPNVLSNYNIEKAIYLDTDTLIIDDLTDLYNFDLASNTCGGCFDIGTDKHVVRMQLKQGFAINGGVLLMDVNKMNQINWVEKANELNKQGKIQWVDQDVLNIVLDDKIALLDLKWNMQTSYFKNDKNNKAVIAHFTSNGKGKKPWETKYRYHPFIEIYFEFMGKSGFYHDYLKYKLQFILWKVNNKLVKLEFKN